MVSFTESVKAIIKHRKANPAITAKHKLATDYDAVASELEAFTAKRLGLPVESAPNFPFQRRPSSPPAVGVAAAIKRAAQGTAVVVDWLMSGGKPVAQELADRRAATCVDCPKNVVGSWYTVAPAELIRETLSARSDLKLATPFDDRLKSCDVCKCLMRLKVWTPLSFIVQRTKPEILDEFPTNCWIAKRDA